MRADTAISKVTFRDPIDAEMEALADALSDSLVRGDRKLWEETKVSIAQLFEAFFRREISKIRAAGGAQ